MSQCPCGSEKSYEQCCKPFIEKKEMPQTPEQLMRSRYTAYSLAKIDYIKNTMKGRPLINFDESEVKKWALSVTWAGLKVLQLYMETPEKGFVEFKALFRENNQLKHIHEISEFHQEDNQWFYVDGSKKKLPVKNSKIKVARNSPCPCGSGKKFKNCHDK
ncbi:preprotein translocase SecA [Legionella antarctica]|uniref:Preprotein translocase SecA n=1 Tax=Legionella antarctica TaxID=2708020 RepID=A0A6F8T453_9GAMM|nr:YchJ family protein [Legionella antarctica]BCA94802.1 preprotein translocase SecA [Legionella antarctica]